MTDAHFVERLSEVARRLAGTIDSPTAEAIGQISLHCCRTIRIEGVYDRADTT
jgi:hypothetical protein